MFQDSPDAVILHLSDLHFTNYLQNVSGVVPPNPHNFNILQRMHAHIRILLERYKEKCIVVVTGDLTTSGDPAAYELVSTYLRGHIWVSGLTNVGLDIVDRHNMEDRLLVVPGNHDIWFDHLSDVIWGTNPDRRKLYGQYFGQSYTKRIYPLMVGGISLLFFLLDSNCLAESDWNPGNATNALGAGRVGPEQMEELKAEYEDLIEQLRENPIPKFDLNNTVRVAVLHHHLADPTETPQDLKDKLLRLKDAHEVTGLLVDHFHVRVVLCGHRHHPYHCPLPNAKVPKAWMSCGGTATQVNSKVNSYKVYWIKHVKGLTKISMQEFCRDSREDVNRRTFRARALIPL